MHGPEHWLDVGLRVGNGDLPPVDAGAEDAGEGGAADRAVLLGNS
jgi:hypothetical protein